jgi:hypothetical protein
VCTDAYLRRCQQYRFENGSLYVDNGGGDMQSYAAHISYVSDADDETDLTMEDQGTVTGDNCEDVATIGAHWETGADLAQAWNEMME